MYTKNESDGHSRDPYIPSNYRGNALYFEYPKPCGEDTCENASDVEACDGKKDVCDKKEPCQCTRQEGGFLHSLLSKISDPEILPILILLAFVFFSGKRGTDRCSDDDGPLFLVLLLLFL